MKYSGSLVKEEREKIFKLFLDNVKMKFSEIEKRIKIRSNMVSYHLERMQKEGIIEKKGDYYFLAKNAEKYIPMFSNMVGHELSPLPIVLVAAVRKGKILLIKRNRRPYKGYLSLIGGKMLLEESFKQASLRQVKQKSGLDGKFISINSVMQERVEGDGMIKHNFILVFVKVAVEGEKFKASEHGNLEWFDIKKLGKEKIITSDLWMIKNKLNSNLYINKIYIREKDGEIISSDIN